MGKIRDYIENSREVYTESVAVDIDVEPKSTTPINMSAMLQGTISLSNTIQSIGFNTTLYTGNGTTQDIVTGVDMKSNWDDYSGIATWSAGTYNTGSEVKFTDTSGRILRCVCLQDGVTSDPNALLDFTDATFSDWKIESKTFGGRVWIKSRSVGYNHYLEDTIRGAGKEIGSNRTDPEYPVTDSISSFNTDGFSIGSNVGRNANGATYASWTDQTTFVESFLTSHNKPAIRETNVITGYVQIKYKGSGLAGHEIEHGMGRELALWKVKNLSSTTSWGVYYGDETDYLSLDLTSSTTDNSTFWNDTKPTDVNATLGAITVVNESNSLHILYGYTNAYIDENDNLQGNYEIGIYQGTGVAGNKVTTKGKPAYVMIKRIDSAESWSILDLARNNFDGELVADTSAAEVTSARITTQEDGFIFDSGARNTSGGQYLYIVVYDNDSGSGSSKYAQPTETTQAQITGGVASIPNGFNATSGVDNKIVSVSGTLIPTNNWQGE